MSVYFIVAIIFICFVLEALYSGGEVALFAADINKIRYYERRVHRLQKAVKLKRTSEWFISTALSDKSGIITLLRLPLVFVFFGSVRGEQIAYS